MFSATTSFSLFSPSFSLTGILPTRPMNKPVPLKVYGRTHYACTRCKVSKIKCSGEKPACSNCKTVGKGDACVYPTKDRKIVIMESELDRLHERVRSLEESLRASILDREPSSKLSSAVLPPREDTWAIIDHVYQTYSTEFYLIDMPLVKEFVENAYLGSAPDNVLAYIYALLAFGSQLMSLDADDPGVEYYRRGNSLMSLSQEIIDNTFIQTAILLALFAANSRRFNAVFNFIGVAARSALGQGFHRKPTSAENPMCEEKQKRLWWTVFVIDTVWATKTVNFQYTDTDVDLPLENPVDLNDGFDLRILELNVHLAKYMAKLIRLIYGPNIRTFSINYINTSQFNQKQLLHNVCILLNDLIRNFELPMLAQFLYEDIINRTGNTRTLASLVLRYNHFIVLITRPVLLVVFDSAAEVFINDFKDVMPMMTKALVTACVTIDIIAELVLVSHVFYHGYWDSQHCFLALLLLVIASLQGKRFPQVNKAIAILNLMKARKNKNACKLLRNLVEINELLRHVGFSMDLSLTLNDVDLSAGNVQPCFSMALADYMGEKWRPYFWGGNVHSKDVLARIIREIQEFH